MKRLLAACATMAICAAVALAGCGALPAGNGSSAATPSTPSQSAPANTDAVDRVGVDAVVSCFKDLAAVPRQSHHEAAVSDFLVSWAKGAGLAPEKDASGNVIFDIPATAGYEKLPLTILQAHMDMVCVANGDMNYNPETDPVKVVETAESLIANGTSLGADDGAGVALIMAIAKGEMNHGPLRAIFTTNEEDGMTGALKLDKKYVEDGAYLVNLAGQGADTATTGSAAGKAVNVSGPVETAKPTGNLALNLKVSGLEGGHSGRDIDKGRANAVVVMASILQDLENRDIAYELASFAGGASASAIPVEATSTVVINSADRGALESTVQAYIDGLNRTFSGIEDGIEIAVTDADMVDEVASDEARRNALWFMTEIVDGVFTVTNEGGEDRVESSSNLGVFTLNRDGVTAATYVRSSIAAREDKLVSTQIELAEQCGYKAESTRMATTWAASSDSKILRAVQSAYKDVNGSEINVGTTHAETECCIWATRNSKLDMISLGPDISDAHSPNESLDLASLSKTWQLLEKLLVSLEG